MPATVDTNVLVYDTFSDTSLHREARDRLDSLDRWVIPAMTLHEYVWFMRAEGVDLDFLKMKAREYLGHEKATLVSITVDDLLFALEAMEDYADYNDLLILSVSKRLNIPLFTYDRSLKRKAQQHGVKTL